MFFRYTRRAQRTTYTLRAPRTSLHSLTLALLCIFILAVYSNLARVSTNLFVVPRVTAAARAATPATTNGAELPSTGILQAATTPAAANIDTPQSCVGEPYRQPSDLPLSAAPNGLTTIVDEPTYYHVYATTLPGLRQAVEGCPLRQAAGEFHAATTYKLNWSYTPAVTDGTCHIENVKIGLHINQLMPAFSPGNAISPSVASTWDAYSQALKTHEDGHTALDIQYAERLAAALSGVGNMECGVLTRQVQTIVDSHLAMLNTANELYDSQTNHGATQGAAL